MKKVALVTGSSRGIGRAIALRLASEGFAVAVHCVSSFNKAEEVCAEIAEVGGCAKAYCCDVADGKAVSTMINSICADLGPISVLVNNAGFAQQKLFTDLTDEEWKRMLSVHVDGAFYCTRAVLPAMIREHQGCVVNVSSMWGQVGGSCEVHYSTAKAALIGMTKALAKEVGPSGVRVNCVAPGVIKTDMISEFDAETLDELAQDAPLCCLGMPDDVAATVAFLVSEQARFITGQVIAPNGGIVI